MSPEGKMRADLSSTRVLALLAIFSALVIVVTMLSKVPVVVTKGYFNIGDTFIFVAAALLGPIYGMIVGGVGSAIADMLNGYMHFAPWTFFIKGVEGLIAGFLVGFFKTELWSRKGIFLSVLSFVVAASWMVIGYFCAEWIMYDFAAALGELPVNIVQGSISTVIAIMMVPELARKMPDDLLARRRYEGNKF